MGPSSTNRIIIDPKHPIIMQLIEIAKDTFINRDQISKVDVLRSEVTEPGREELGVQHPPKKVGETLTLRITTPDGKTHTVHEDFSARIYESIFANRGS
jgi:hypothetical protein